MVTFREGDRGKHLTPILRVCLTNGTRELKGHTCQLCRSIVGSEMAVLLPDDYMYVLLSVVDLVVHTIRRFFLCTGERQRLGWLDVDEKKSTIVILLHVEPGHFEVVIPS